MLYYEINNIYLELYKLELNGNKNDSFFLELIDLLKEKILEEKILIKELLNDNEDLYDYLYDLDKEVDTPFAKRIADYVRFNGELDIDINLEDDIELKKNKMDMINYAKLYMACTRNVFLIYLSYLQECINNEDEVLFKEKLLNFKYYNSFICHDVEYSNIMNNFDICRDNYINLHFVANTLRLNVSDIDGIIFNCLSDTVITTINQLLSITDMEYNNDDRRVISINNQCMLRAGLSILNEREYEMLKDEMFNIINGLGNDNNKISMDIIYSIVNNRKNDKSRVKRITLGLRPLGD